MVKKIVLTGGPGSGKTTVIEKINQVFSSQGFKVVIVSETATELMNSGVTFLDGTVSLVDFQELVLRMQLAKEEVVDRMIELSKNDNIIVIYDRGTIDNTAYINKEEFLEVLARLNHVKSFTDLMNKYDLVINLVGRADFYTTLNNKARYESANDAIALGDKTLKCWLGHDKVKVVLPKDEMADKINEVLNIINDCLAVKQVKRQEKYSVDLSKTDLDFIKSNGKAMRITQTYLISEEGIEKRVRRVLFNDCVYYVFSAYKVMSDGTKIIVSEKRIDKKSYDDIREFSDSRYSEINKVRYYFTFQGQYFYLDVFDDMKDIGILEINVSDNEEILIPDFVSVIENVTGNELYFNKNIAIKNERELKKVD